MLCACNMLDRLFCDDSDDSGSDSGGEVGPCLQGETLWIP